MPTVLRDGPYVFLFFSSDRGEPPHVHVKRDRHVAKFWLLPVEACNNHGFANHELHNVERIVLTNLATLLEAWYDYFGA
ncbi:MAG: DUF4160 domain-containing protein [Anaerolineales bacterium]|nr:DUF4160 domain-containing protein [Anaerolineales bacterium]